MVSRVEHDKCFITQGLVSELMLEGKSFMLPGLYDMFHGKP